MPGGVPITGKTYGWQNIVKSQIRRTINIVNLLYRLRGLTLARQLNFSADLNRRKTDT
ncbi:MAG: hypothetical protein R6V18_02170 [Desulfuromonadaceae bacterium]